MLNDSYTYNANQELCRQVEPETGATLMGYDGAGNLAWTAAGLAAGTACNAGGTIPTILARKVVRGYDARNRLKTLSFADSDGNQVWTYAPDGLPTNIVTTVLSDGRLVTNQYSYNRRRLLATETQKLTNWSTYAVTHQYNANGHLANLMYPTAFQGSVVDYAPNALGQPTKAGTFASAVTYYPNGAIQSFTYGNGLKHTLTQNLRGLSDTSCDFASSCNTGAVLNDGYDYDANGNVAAISDGRTGNAGDRSMTYDALDRLTQVVAPGMFGTATYSYDVLDNLTRTKVTGGNKPRDHYYCYDATWRLTTLRTGSCTGTTAMSLAYDAQGNLANRNGIAYTFDYGNRLRQVAGQENQYLYDGHGRRVASNRLVNGSSVRRSIYGLDGKLLFVQDQGEAKRKEYIYLGGSLLAERSLPNTGAATPVSIRYQHTDALGSPVAVSDESQVVVERTAYEPYGWAANRASRNGPGFTGHHEDAATGLVYMQQRYYDPFLQRFDSVDPVTANSVNGRNFNRYWYANNNPYRFTDPDGRNPFNPVDVYYFAKDVGGLIVTEIVAGTAFIAGDDDVLSMALDDMSAGAFDAAASTAGFVSPAPGAGREIKAGSRIFKMARDHGKNERHGDSGRAMAKAAERVEKLKESLAAAAGRESKKIEQKIKNIIRDAQKKDKGEEHSRRDKK